MNFDGNGVPIPDIIRINTLPGNWDGPTQKIYSYLPSCAKRLLLEIIRLGEPPLIAGLYADVMWRAFLVFQAKKKTKTVSFEVWCNYRRSK